VRSGARGNGAARPAPAGAGAAAAGPASGLRVLFLGSSLTYANDMPLQVRALAQAAGEALDVATVARGGASLEDLWHDGAALRQIRLGGWHFVVLQQGPSSTPANRQHLRQWSCRFAAPIRQAGARPALYMVWPSSDRMQHFDDVSESYAQAAAEVDGLLLPAGEAWRAVWRRRPQAPLLKRDGVHPTAAGSYTVALSIFGMLCARSPVGLPARLRLRGLRYAEVPEALAPLLQEGAAEANERFGRR
jgi:lysophospholipase L1-like esterase